MIITIAILVLLYSVLGKDVKPLLERVKSVDWRGKAEELKERFRPWAVKVGRAAARPLLQFYYVLTDEKTSLLERVLIYAALIYVIRPSDLVPRALYKFLGIVDDGVAVMYVYRTVKGKITPQIETKVDKTLDQWFGVECEIV